MQRSARWESPPDITMRPDSSISGRRLRPCVRMRRGGSPYNALSEGCSLGRADPPQEDEGMGGQYRDGEAGGDRGTARQTGSGAQRSRARGQEGAAGRGCGCEGRRGTSVQKGFGRARRCSWQDAAVSTDQGHRRAIVKLAALAKSLHSLSVFRQGFPILGVQIGS